MKIIHPPPSELGGRPYHLRIVEQAGDPTTCAWEQAGGLHHLLIVKQAGYPTTCALLSRRETPPPAHGSRRRPPPPAHGSRREVKTTGAWEQAGGPYHLCMGPGGRSPQPRMGAGGRSPPPRKGAGGRPPSPVQGSRWEAPTTSHGSRWEVPTTCAWDQVGGPYHLRIWEQQET